jgi:hypothetical protein
MKNLLDFTGLPHELPFCSGQAHGPMTRYTSKALYLRRGTYPLQVSCVSFQLREDENARTLTASGVIHHQSPLWLELTRSTNNGNVVRSYNNIFAILYLILINNFQFKIYIGIVLSS